MLIQNLFIHSWLINICRDFYKSYDDWNAYTIFKCCVFLEVTMDTNVNKKDDGKGIAEGDEVGNKVKEFLKNEVPDWEDEAKVSARFKAFSGQRCDWEPLYLFWRDLILKVARHLRVFIIRPSQVKTVWFSRADGLSPLCLDHVLVRKISPCQFLLFHSKLVSCAKEARTNIESKHLNNSV